MNVKQMRDLIYKYRCKEPVGLDSTSVAIIRGYKRMRVTEAEQLLSYIDAVCITSSRSAHILFIRLTDQPYPTFEQFEKSKFRIEYGYDVYTSAIYDLYNYDVSGDGSRFLTVNELDVYTKLYKISDAVYCTRKSLRLYKFRPVDIHYMRMLYGEEYIKDISYPNDMSCAELAFIYNNPTKVVFSNGDSLTLAVRQCKDFHPLSNPCIVDYSIGYITTGKVITITACKGANLSVNDLTEALDTILQEHVEKFTVQQLDKHRIAIFIESQK